MFMPTSKLSFMTSTVADVTSLPALVSSAPPIESMASAISFALRVAVPWFNSDATREAVPPLPGGSYAPPARTIRRIVTSGCSWCITTITCIPFGSVRSS